MQYLSGIHALNLQCKYTFSNLCHEDKQLAMADDAYKIFFNAKGSMKGITKAQQNFLEYVQNGHISDDFTQELDEAVKEMKFSDRKRGIYDLVAGTAFAERRRIERGIERGAQRGLFTSLYLYGKDDQGGSGTRGWRIRSRAGESYVILVIRQFVKHCRLEK